jgi:hypothetical protein
MSKTIKLSGKIVTKTEPTEIRIKPTTGDVWTDFGYWLEATNFMAYQAMQEQGWDKNKMLQYISEYLNNSLDDISIKS